MSSVTCQEDRGLSCLSLRPTGAGGPQCIALADRKKIDDAISYI